MRTHIVANFFLTLVIFLSLDLARDNFSNRRLAAVGLACGFATATKYTAGVVALVPVMFLIARRLPYRDCLLAIVRMAGFALLGFFLTDPFLFLKFQDARAALAEQGSYIAGGEFRWQTLFDLSRVYVFLRYLIPYGTLPLLWVLFYASVAVAFMSRATRRISIPLALFLLLYLYPMAKGYFDLPSPGVSRRAGMERTRVETLAPGRSRGPPPRSRDPWCFVAVRHRLHAGDGARRCSGSTARVHDGRERRQAGDDRVLWRRS